MGSPRGAWTKGCQPGTALRNLTTHPQQPGLAMAAPRPPPAISVSVSAPAFYAPQKKFAPVVAPKPKVNPFRAGDSEPPVAAGAQRAQMGRVGEIPPPPPEGMRLGLGLPIPLERQVGVGGLGTLGLSGKVVAKGAGRSHPVLSRCSYLILELLARSQNPWDCSKSPAWGWEAGMWARNLPLWIRSLKCNGSCMVLQPIPGLSRPASLRAS